VTLAALLPVFLVLAVLVRVETGGVLVRHTRVDDAGRTVTVARFRTRRSRSVARPGTTFSVDISGRVGPVGRLLRSTGLVAVPELVRALLRRVRYAGGVPDAPRMGSATPPRPDEAEVDARQLAS
jgi:lipopolysaccharide/colanic/teichoic acid biosynthesis glycosyltransferase